MEEILKSFVEKTNRLNEETKEKIKELSGKFKENMIGKYIMYNNTLEDQMHYDRNNISLYKIESISTNYIKKCFYIDGPSYKLVTDLKGKVQWVSYMANDMTPVLFDKIDRYFFITEEKYTEIKNKVIKKTWDLVGTTDDYNEYN